jgi:hypothetical protein
MVFMPSGLLRQKANLKVIFHHWLRPVLAQATLFLNLMRFTMITAPLLRLTIGIAMMTMLAAPHILLIRNIIRQAIIILIHQPAPI